MSHPLTVIENKATPAERVAALEAEAKQAVAEHLTQACEMAGELAALAEQIGAGGDLYPAGPKEAFRQMSIRLRADLNTIKAVVTR